jgi:hypothetical protein
MWYDRYNRGLSTRRWRDADCLIFAPPGTKQERHEELKNVARCIR